MKTVSFLLFIVVSINALNIIELINTLNGSDQTELVFNFDVEEESEKSKEGQKEKGEDEVKYIHRHLIVINRSSSIDRNDFLGQAARFESLSYKEALIQPPDFI